MDLSTNQKDKLEYIFWSIILTIEIGLLLLLLFIFLTALIDVPLIEEYY